MRRNSPGSRSTALADLRWLIGLMMAGLFIGAYEHVPTWVLNILGAAVAIALTIYFAAYVWFGINNPDALRSGNFTNHDEHPDH